MKLWQDVRYGARMLRNSPAFTATAVLTLALGIGVTTAVFSVCDALLWKPVALPHLETLAMVLQRVPESPDQWNSVTPGDIAEIQRANRSLESLATWQDGMANLIGGGGEPERVSQTLVTANFFDVVGVKPAKGRAFEPGEDQPGREREVILSDRVWHRRFGADPQIIGRSIRLDDQNFLVTGVMPASFDFPLATEIWTPMALTPAQRDAHRGNSLVAVGRLRAGHSIADAAADVNGIATQLERSFPDSNHNRRFLIWPAHDFLVERETNQYLIMLLWSVIFVLLIACMNVANLQFARATGRIREVALRTALGAGRGRLIAQLVTESVLLSLMGAALGLLIGRWSMNLIKNGMPPEIERYIIGWKDIQMDGRALLFTLVAAVAAGILSGLAPAWQFSRPNLTDSLKEGGRGSSVGRGRYRLRNFLVASEIALAVILLVGASLMVRGFNSLLEAGRKLEPETLLTLRLGLTDNKYHEPYSRAAFYGGVLQRISRLPGVKSATAVSSLPYSNHSSGRAFTIEGRAEDRNDQPTGMYQVASPSYFDTLHVPLRAGRFLTDQDGPDAAKVAVVNEEMVRRWFKDRSPIGQHIKIGTPDSKSPWLTIVGVVGDIAHNPYDRGPRRMLYVPFAQAPALWMDIGIRTAGNPLNLGPAVTAAIRAVDPEQPITDMQTMAKSIHNRAIGLNYMAVLMGIFGIVALVLSAIGVYGVMAYLVSEQTHEIGIRMALGAPRQNVLGMMFQKGLKTTIIGLFVGLPLAYAFARLMASLVFGVSPTDPVTFVGIPLALVAAAATAIYVPARRAMKIDPIVALRYE